MKKYILGIKIEKQIAHVAIVMAENDSAAKDMFTQVVGFLNQLEETCNKCKSMEELETNYELQLTALQVMSMLQHNPMLNLFSKLIRSVYTLI